MNLTKKILGRFYDVPAIKFFFELFFVILPIAFVVRTFFFGLYQVPSGSMETTLLVGERFFADKLSYWFRKPMRGEIIAINAPNYTFSTNPIVRLWEKYGSFKVENWTKRIIAIPGDHIKGVIEDGKAVVYLNGEKLDEPYVNKYPITQIELPATSSSYSKDTPYALRSFDPSVSWQDQPFYKIDPKRLVLLPNGKPLVIWPEAGDRSKRDVFDIKLGENQYWCQGDNRRGSDDSRVFGPFRGDMIHGRIIFRIWSLDSDESWWIAHLIKHPIDFWSRIRWSRCLQFVK